MRETMNDFENPEERVHHRHSCSVAVGVIGGTALLGAGTSLFAGNQQANAANQANQNQMQMYNNNVNLEAPYRQAGQTALNTIGQDQANGTGFAAPFTQSNFQSDPGYQFQLNQGNQAIQRSAAAQGGLLSGAAAKAIAGYTTNLANTTYGDAYNRYLQTSNQQFGQLASVANMGQNATNATVGVGQNTANQVSQGITGAANATAAGEVGASNALSGAGNNLLQYNLLSQAGLLGGGASGYGSQNPLSSNYALPTVPYAGMDMYGN